MTETSARTDVSETGGTSPAPIRIGAFTLDVAGARLIDAGGAHVSLTRGQFAMLQALATRPGRVLSREFLSRIGCSTGAEPYERGVDMVVMRLRKRLEADPKQPQLIVTVPGVGYRFDMPPAPAHAAPPRLAVATAAEPPIAPAGANRIAFSRRQLVAAGISVVLLGTAGAGSLAWRRRYGPGAPSEGPSVVVPPFSEPIGASPGGYLGRVFAEQIQVLLSTFPGIRVLAAARESEAAAALSVARGAGADYLLEGTAARLADGLRITVQLVRVGTGQYVWATRFETAGFDPFALQNDVAERVYQEVAGLQGQMIEEDQRAAWRRDAPELSEYDYYLRGYETFWSNTAEGNLRARAVWQEGLDRFPNSALLRNKIAWTYLWAAESGFAPIDRQDISQAWTLAQESQAIHVKPRLVVWLNHFIMCALYAWHDGDFRRSVVEAEATQAMVPYDAHSRGVLSFYLANAGDVDRAAAWGEWASTRDLRPNPLYRANIAWALYLAGRTREALAAFGDAARDFPVQYVALLARLGRREEAMAELARGQSPFRDTIANERLLPLRPDLQEGYLNDLRAAGMPEV